MHWFAIVFHAVRRVFAAQRDIPAQSALDRVPPEALRMMGSR